MTQEKILVLDFGGQYDQLIARRVRDLRVYAELQPYNKITVEEIKAEGYKGIIFTGGPNSVYDPASPHYDPALLDAGIPILGICYGHQLLAWMADGKIGSAGNFSEYGKVTVTHRGGVLFEGVPEECVCWMSHTDSVMELPQGFQSVASTGMCAVAAMEDVSRRLFGVQFHPEVQHTQYGKTILGNFLFKVCGCSGGWHMESYCKQAVEAIRAKVGEKPILVGSGIWMDINKISWHSCCEHTGTVIHVAVDGSYAGHVEIEDELKDDAIEAIRRLKPRKTVMLTGDQAAAGEHFAGILGMDECYCGLMPENKVTIVEQLLKKPENRALAFVGDGINDAPVLSRADLGIAMGALGSDAAIEAADVVLMDDKPSKVALAVRTAKKTMRIVWENVVFSLIVKLAVLVLEVILTVNAGSALSAYAMPLAAFADVGVLVLAVLNATRALYVPKN
ncbi:MAG: glutamine-hydrolyzing GMP synthase [Firmicutes bacterium]|nr:glutamine-hydrolyzing GMP synthase [Bacillota bacterium]